MNDIAARHSELAAAFARVAGAVTDWDAPTPVPEWRARDIVGHLTGWLPGMLSGMGVALATVEVGDDPAAAWREHSANVAGLLDDEQLARVVQTWQGDSTLGEVLATFYLPDVFLHRWDLARASGQDSGWPDAEAAAMASGMASVVEMLAASGQYGRPVVLDDTHTGEERLAAVIGRDPQWAPPIA